MAEDFEINHKHKEDVLELIGRFSEFGATPEGGVKRLAASNEDKSARDYLCHWFEQKGFVTLIDSVGNIFGVLELDGSQTETSFYCGSHLDSQPHGGKFDGTLGVVFACIAALAIKELVERGELKSTFKNFVVACWTSEEGARFQPSLLGSRVFADRLSTDDAWACEDANGITLKQALGDIGYIGSDTPPKPNHYLEVHIEQGVKLESEERSIGIVTSAWGARKLTLSIEGRADHTGPTPMDERKDALLAASKIIVTVNQIAEASKQPFHSSVARIEVSPNSPNTVVAQASLWVEFRAADETLLDAAEEKLEAAIIQISKQAGCYIEQRGREVRSVVSFDEKAIEIASDALDRSAIQHLLMTTIAGHDALQLQSVCPSTLMFVPSKDGISHTPDEHTSDADIERGFEATVAAITSLISNPSSGGAHV